MVRGGREHVIGRNGEVFVVPEVQTGTFELLLT